MNQELLQSIPSVDKIFKDFSKENIIREVLLSIIREETESLRYKILNGKESKKDIEDQLYKAIKTRIKILEKGKIKKVINGTGIVLHTGLGRAPFSSDFFDDLNDTITGYCNLEFDLETGKRGERLDHIGDYLHLLSGAENSVVVNNNAAALVLILNTIAQGQDVIVSRGELIEIGGSFRLPDVIQKSGAIIKEVGTTNRTHLKDYKKAISNSTGGILIAHTSNYKIQGFTKSPTHYDLIELGHKYNIPVILDQGSGDFCTDEGDIVELVKQGFDLVCFSGDKLLGGPQSGIILGKNELINRIQKNPLYRAFRCDKFTIFALEWTLKNITGNRSKKIGKNQYFSRSISDLESIAIRITKSLQPSVILKYGLKVEQTLVEVGSGSLPEKKIKSIGLKFMHRNAKELSEWFRNCPIPTIGYISSNSFIIDLKAVCDKDVEILIQQLQKLPD